MDEAGPEAVDAVRVSDLMGQSQQLLEFRTLRYRIRSRLQKVVDACSADCLIFLGGTKGKEKKKRLLLVSF